MTITNISLFSLLAFSQIASAQILNTDNIVKQIDGIERTVERVGNRLNNTVADRPFALSSMPPIENLLTEPLTLLPQKLTITTDLGQPGFTEIELDDGWRAVQNQWIVLADGQTRQTLESLGAIIDADSSYAGLGLSLLRFTVPVTLDSKQALAKHLSPEVLDTLDRNHIYAAQSKQPSAVAQNVQNNAHPPLCNVPVRIGMIDSAIEQQHTAFADADITARSFLINNLSSPTIHGTAVASVLVGNQENLKPLLNQAELYSAEVFYRQSDYSQGATLSAMIEALNWLVEQHVGVINMSLAGPNNRILERIITATINKGSIIVAAAGNEGPAAEALYPAGYSDVIAVSAHNAEFESYRWSNRGSYIDYSALGVNVLTAQGKHKLGKESGTSMAAPVVSAALACLLAKKGGPSEPLDRNAILSTLSDQAIDLGAKGWDPIFGIGAIKRQ